MSGPRAFLRVAHVVCSGGFAGVERYLARMAPALADSGVEVAVIGGDAELMSDALRGTGVGFFEAADPRGARRALARLPRPDLVNTHMTEADVVGLRYGLPRRIPVVSTRHFASHRGGSLAKRLALRPIAGLFSAQIAISEFVAASIEGSSSIVHTGVDDVDGPDTIDDEHEDVALLVQRLEPEKDTETAVRIWAASHARERGWTMRIVGEGSEQGRLERLAVELGVADSISFLGRRSDIDTLLSAAGLFIAPTPREGLGIAVLEAMAAGVPVVASDAGGHRETVGPVPGAALFPPADAVAGAAVLDALVGDPEGRARYGASLRCRQRAEFSIDQQIAATLEVYRTVARR